MSSSTKPSSKWSASRESHYGHALKRRRVDDGGSSTLSDTQSFPRNVPSLPPNRHDSGANQYIDLETTEVKNGESMAGLRKMVLGTVEYKASQTTPGKYLAIDCEMVGVGIEGRESSLARVSIINYTGAVILDVFVRQLERVIDYRTQWSGIRSADLVGSAKPFKEVQQLVADLIKDRILVGHAIHNDLKALLLSHPRLLVRDTQSLAYKHGVIKSRRPALRVLLKQELDITIQQGEHNSVTDARATMALFRLYRKQWENGFRSSRALSSKNRSMSSGKLADTPLACARLSSSSASGPALNRKRKHSALSELSDADIDTAADASSSSSRTRAHSPSPSNVPRIRHDISTSPKPHKQKSRSEPPASSGSRKGISSGILTITKRAGKVKDIRKKGTPIELGNGDRDGGVRKSSKNRTEKVGEKWWKSLGDGKKSGITL